MNKSYLRMENFELITPHKRSKKVKFKRYTPSHCMTMALKGQFGDADLHQLLPICATPNRKV